MKTSFTAPAGFDPRNALHVKKVLGKLAEKHGSGWRIISYEADTRTIHAQQSTVVAETEQSGVVREVRLPVELAKPSAGEMAAAQLADTFPGFYMTRFEPHTFKAVIAKLTDAEVNARGAIAVALGVKPWEVGVKARPDGGFDLTLPRSYVPSKHDDKLTEAAETAIGHPGWYVTVNARNRTARVVPSEPPTFPEAFPTPLERLGNGDPDRVPFGRILPGPGEDIGPELVIDWTASAWALVAGTPGAGKTVALNAIIADSLSNGSQLVVVDDVSKAVDFEWCKPFCRPGGWGCESIEAGVAALGLIREEGRKRALVLKDMGINNWLDMPKSSRFTPILVVVDEVTALIVPDPIPKGVPKDHPLYVEIAERNLARAMLQSFMRKIVAELRFVGIRMVLSTQATNANTGVDPGLRTLIGHKVLQGVNPSRAARSQIFADETAVPQVPENVKAGGARARGVGVATLEGQAPAIYKSYFATPAQYANALKGLVTVTHAPEPTPSQIDRFLPSLHDGKDEPVARRRDVSPVSGRSLEEIGRDMGDPNVGWDRDPETGEKLTGYAKANAARAAVVKGAKQEPTSRTHSTDTSDTDHAQ